MASAGVWSACGGGFSTSEAGAGGTSASNATSASANAASGTASSSATASATATGTTASASSATVSSSASTCSGGGVPGLDVANLMLWLKGDAGVIQAQNRVTGWTDQSGKNNHATLPVCSGACFCGSDCMPEYVAQAINCLPAVHFRKDKAYQLQIKDADFLQWHGSNTPFEAAVAVVARYTNQPGGDPNGDHGVGTLYFKGSLSAGIGPGLLANFPTTNQVGVVGLLDASQATQQVATTTTAYNNGMPHLFVLTRVANLLYLRIDGQVAGSAPGTSNASTQGMPARIGSLFDGASHRLDGDIAEIIALKGNVNAALPGIEKYLKAKYAIP